MNPVDLHAELCAYEAFRVGSDYAYSNETYASDATEPETLQIQQLQQQPDTQDQGNDDLYAHLTKQQQKPKAQGTRDVKKLLPGNINRLLSKPGSKDPNE